MRRIFLVKKQKGAATLIAVVVLGVLIGGLILAISQMFDNTIKEIARQRNRIAALQALQEFAVLAQRANDVYVGNGNACPAGWQNSPVGFCWQPPFPSPNTCIANPIGNGTNICLQIPGAAASAGATLNVASLMAIPDTGTFGGIKERIHDAIEFREELVAELQRKVLSAFDNQAYAVRPELHLPDDAAPAGPAQATINNVGCGPIPYAAQPVHCKQCTTAAAGPPPGNVRCIELRVCVNTSQGCRNIATFNDWYRQRVGIIRRF